MSKTVYWLTTGLTVSLVTGACAGWDNPTALADLQSVAEFEIAAARVETFEEIEIHVHITESGNPMRIGQAQMEIEHEASGAVRTVAMQPEGDGYAAHVTFFEAGGHHLHFMGVPHKHRLTWELGEHEIEAHNAHRVIGPYWVELEVSPAPVLEGTTGHIHVHVFQWLPDDTPGAEVTGLDVELEVHDLNGAQTALAVMEEGPGEYEGEYSFSAAGMYELHVGIDVNGTIEEGEFHIPVLSPDTGEAPGDGEGGGHGHG